MPSSKRSIRTDISGGSSGQMGRRHRATESVVADRQPIMEQSMNERPRSVEKASGDALMDDVGDSGPVSGLELPDTENKGKMRAQPRSSKLVHQTHPVSGTSLHKIVGKQSSKQRLCADCGSTVSHSGGNRSASSLSNHDRNRPSQCGRLTGQPDATSNKWLKSNSGYSIIATAAWRRPGL